MSCFFRSCVDAELLKYVEDAYPRGSCSVYCTRAKDSQEGDREFELTVVISNSNYSPKNYRFGALTMIFGQEASFVFWTAVVISWSINKYSFRL